jgi:hypothetical protein
MDRPRFETQAAMSYAQNLHVVERMFGVGTFLCQTFDRSEGGFYIVNSQGELKPAWTNESTPTGATAVWAQDGLSARLSAASFLSFRAGHQICDITLGSRVLEEEVSVRLPNTRHSNPFVQAELERRFTEARQHNQPMEPGMLSRVDALDRDPFVLDILAQYEHRFPDWPAQLGCGVLQRVRAHLHNRLQ